MRKKKNPSGITHVQKPRRNRNELPTRNRKKSEKTYEVPTVKEEKPVVKEE